MHGDGGNDYIQMTGVAFTRMSATGDAGNGLAFWRWRTKIPSRAAPTATFVEGASFFADASGNDASIRRWGNGRPLRL